MEEHLRGHAVRSLSVDGAPAVFVNDSMMVHSILVKNSRSYGRGDLFRKGRNFSSVGMLSEDESSHRHYRRLANPFLRASKIDEYVPVMRGIARDVVGSWPAGQPVDIQAEMCRAAGSIALATVFPDLAPEASSAISERLAVLTLGTIRKPLYGKAAQAQARAQSQGQGAPATELTRARQEVQKLLLSCVAEQERSPSSTTGYLSALLSDSDEAGNRLLTPDQICDETVMMLISGTVTTASVMSWALYMLAEEPLLEKKVIEDMAKTGNDYAARGVDRASYTYRFLTEILRLYPPVWISCRKTQQDVMLGDHALPEGVNVVFSSYLLHRNPERYPDPHRCDPDRWLTDRPGVGDETLYIPFGIGPKVCIGESFAWQELAVLLGTVLQRWRLSTAPGSQVDTAAETTLHPSDLPMIPQPR